MRFEIRRRDVLARTALLRKDEETLHLPAAVDTTPFFPDLGQLEGTNMPLAAPRSLVDDYPPPPSSPVILHPAHIGAVQSGDCVMVANWHTALQNPRNYVDWLIGMKEQTPPDTAWYAPATALPSNVHLLCYSGFDLFDFRAVDLMTARRRFCTPEGDFPAEALKRGICSCPGCLRHDLKVHNREALLRQVALAGLYIEEGRIRDLVEARCRADAAQVAILRLLDSHYPFMEVHTPVARGATLRANSAESLQRAEVHRFAERVLTRYLPPAADVAVLLPCSAKKPYSLSRSHRLFQQAVGGRAHELIVTSPLGLVPRELECMYPAAQYDVPVTGTWDAEECAVISGVLARYLARHRYRRVIAHLEGGALRVAQMAADACGITLEYSCQGHPAHESALAALDTALDGERRLKDDRLHGMLSFQFGLDADTRGISQRGRFPALFYTRREVQVFSIDAAYGLLRPTLDGWNLVPEVYRVEIDDFIPEGDVLAPGVVRADNGIRAGDEVLVSGPRVMATGRAAMPGSEMLRSGRGVAVRVRKIRRL